MPSKKLNWGETPLDSLSHEELLLAAKRMYSALVAAKSCLRVQRASSENNPFWGVTGHGGRSLAKVEQAMQAVDEGYSSDEIFRCYYRYANDLLFDSSEFDIGSKWVVCDYCSVMLGDSRQELVGKRCIETPFCRGEGEGCFRKLEWGDLNAL